MLIIIQFVTLIIWFNQLTILLMHVFKLNYIQAFWMGWKIGPNVARIIATLLATLTPTFLDIVLSMKLGIFRIEDMCNFQGLF